MAEIKIIGNISNTSQSNRFDEKDIALLGQNRIINNFGTPDDYVEYHIHDILGNPLRQAYSYLSYKSPSNVALNIDGTYSFLEVDPIEDLKKEYSNGEFQTTYNFFRNKLGLPVAPLFIKEISDDRTKLKVGSTFLNNDLLGPRALALVNEINTTSYLKSYLANFGRNNTPVIINVALDTTEDDYYVLIKLYSPLSEDISVKDTFWIVDEIIDSYTFDINLDKLVIPPPPPTLRGPNFDIEIANQNNVATSYQTYTSLINSVQTTSISSYRQLLSLITSQSIDINVDYTVQNNFVFFSSAEERLKNFYGKIKEIED